MSAVTGRVYLAYEIVICQRDHLESFATRFEQLSALHSWLTIDILLMSMVISLSDSVGKSYVGQCHAWLRSKVTVGDKPLDCICLG
jgi:hypothetical protein